jgi:hypothetical protein
MPEKELPPGSLNLPRSVHALCGMPAASCRSPGCKLLTVRLLTAGRSCKADSRARMGLGWCWCLLQELGGSALEHLPCCGHLVLPVAAPSVGRLIEGTVSEPPQKNHFLINGT